MFQQIRLKAWSEGLRSQPSLPLRVELWNGQRFDFSPEAPRVTVRVPRPGALRYLLSPSLYTLGRAYVEGALDVSGRASDMIAVVNALAGDPLAARQPALGRLLGALGDALGDALGGGHTRQRDARAVR